MPVRVQVRGCRMQTLAGVPGLCVHVWQGDHLHEVVCEAGYGASLMAYPAASRLRQPRCRFPVPPGRPTGTSPPAPPVP